MARTLTDKEREIIEGNRTLIVNTPEPLELGDPDPLPKRPEPLESIIERTMEISGSCGEAILYREPGEWLVWYTGEVIGSGSTIREAVEAAAKKAMEGREAG